MEGTKNNSEVDIRILTSVMETHSRQLHQTASGLVTEIIGILVDLGLNTAALCVILVSEDHCREK